MHNQEKIQSIKTHKELKTSVREFVDKDIKIIILNILHVFKNIKKENTSKIQREMDF